MLPGGYNRSGMNQGVASGSLLILFLYDVAEAIRLDGLRQALGAPPAKREPPFRQPAPDYVRFVTPPVIEPLPPLAVDLGTKISGRVAYYEYGILTVQLEIPFEGSWDAVVELAARWMNAPELEQIAASAVRDRVAKAKGALVGPYAEQLSEDYCIIHLTRAQDAAGTVLNARELIEQYGDQIAQIVRGEVARFSATERAEILERCAGGGVERRAGL
jgi:hypothetical protein